MEIKVGDKVRVSKDAPRIYTPDWIDEMFNLVFKVTKVEDGNAMVVFAERTRYKTVLTAIPCKYLIKVDAEAKEAKFKKGDKVRFKKIYTVVSVDDGQVFIDSAGNHINEDCLELYAEPTEQTEAEKTDTDNIVDDFAKVMEGYRKVFADIADNFDWMQYEADLAKEIALKVANKYSDPKDAAEYAVSVAKAVVETLKKK